MFELSLETIFSTKPISGLLSMKKNILIALGQICFWLFTFISVNTSALTAEEELARRYYNSYEAEEALTNSAFFQLSGSSKYLYEGFNGEVSTDVFDGTAYFIELLKKEKLEAFPNATWIPIVGDITFFIPSPGPIPKRVGTPYVEKGLIKAQITTLLGRSWVGGYSTVEAQATAFARNAVDFAKTYNVSFGQKLTTEQMQNVSKDMFWPELRYILGEEVLIPVVYLSQATYSTQSVDGNTLSFGAADLNYESVSVDGAKVEALRELMVNVKNSFVNTSGVVTAGTVNITAGEDITNLSGTISGETVALTAKNIENRTLVVRHDYAYGYSEHADSLAVIESVGDLSLSTKKDYLNNGGDLINQGAIISAGGFLGVEAEGDIHVVTQPVSNYHSQSGSFWSESSASTQSLQSQISAADITLFAHENLVIQGASIESPGMIELLANIGLYIVEGINSESYEYTFKVEPDGFGASSAFSGVGYLGGNEITAKEQQQKTEIIQTVIQAGKDVAITSKGTSGVGGAVVLRGVDLSSGGDLSITAQNGEVYFDLAIEQDNYSSEYSAENMLTFEVKGEGHSIERAYYNKLSNQGILVVDGSKGIYVDYVIPKPEDGTELSQEEILDALGAEPGLAWIDVLRCKPEMTQGECAYSNIEWSGVELAFEEWDYHQQGLTEGAAALLSVAIAIATNGMGGELVGALTSTAPTAMSATQLAFSRALNAGITTLANQASMTLFATGFDIGETLNELGSSEKVHQLLDSMLTAAVVPQSDVSFFDGDNLGFWQQTANALADATVDAGLTAIVQGAVYGYTDEEYLESFQHAVSANAISYLGQQLATSIGDAAEVGDWELGYQLMAHAAAGCLGGALTADNNDADGETGCASGAMGSVIGEMIGGVVDRDLYDNTKASLETDVALNEFMLRANELLLGGADFAKLSAAVTAFVYGMDPSIASSYSEMAYLFNATSKSKEKVFYRYVDENGVSKFDFSYPNQGANDLTRIEEGTYFGFEYILMEEERAWLELVAAADLAEIEAYKQKLRAQYLTCFNDSSKCSEIKLYGENFAPPPQVDGGNLYGDYVQSQDYMRAMLRDLSDAGEVVDDALDIGCSFIGVCDIYVTTQKLNNGEISEVEWVASVGMTVVGGGVASKVWKKVPTGTVKAIGHLRIGHTVPWDAMSKTQRRAFQHSYDRHKVELGLPAWSHKNAESLRLQFNSVVGYIRETGTYKGIKIKPFNDRSVQVNYYESTLNGALYYYYETLSGQFVSAGKSR